MEFIRHDVKINFSRWFAPCALVSLVMCVGLVGVIFYKAVVAKDFNWGTDFAGGTEMQLKFATPIDIDKIRGVLDKEGLGQASVIQFGEVAQNEILIRYKGEESEGQGLTHRVIEALQKQMPENAIELRRVDEVGPKVGRELKINALIALVLANVGIFAYVWFRFTPRFAPGAVIALIHDVIMALGLYTLTGHEVTLSTVAALLTIVGYSVNDTIVIYDRIRDNLKMTRRGDLREVVITSLNQMLGRSVLTSLVTLFSIIAIFVYTQGEIKDFALVMIFGIISGAYSTIFIATPSFIWLDRKKAALADLRKSAVA